jgi:hypothetical protein
MSRHPLVIFFVGVLPLSNSIMILIRSRPPCQGFSRGQSWDCRVAVGLLSPTTDELYQQYYLSTVLLISEFSCGFSTYDKLINSKQG